MKYRVWMCDDPKCGVVVLVPETIPEIYTEGCTCVNYEFGGCGGRVYKVNEVEVDVESTSQ